MEGEIIAYDPFVSGDIWADIPHRRASTLEDLLRDADVVTLHVPLTEQTRGLIGREQLEMMKRDAILINFARGGIVDETALLEALRTGRIYGAALDAMDVEPPTMEAYGDGLSESDHDAPCWRIDDRESESQRDRCRRDGACGP